MWHRVLRKPCHIEDSRPPSVGGYSVRPHCAHMHHSVTTCHPGNYYIGYPPSPFLPYETGVIQYRDGTFSEAMSSQPTFIHIVETLVPLPVPLRRTASSISNSLGPCGPGISQRRLCCAHIARTKRKKARNSRQRRVNRPHAFSHLIICPALNAKLDAFLPSI